MYDAFGHISLEITRSKNRNDTFVVVLVTQHAFLLKAEYQRDIKQRTVLQLRDVEEKSYKEIAEILNINEEQVKVNLFRARQKVKQQFIDIDSYGL